LINWAVLLFWVIFLNVAHNLMYRMHSSFLQLSVEDFDAIHYKCMALYKVGIILFNLAPYLALRIVG
ncbi:MAG: hypothetical protein PVF33_09550, partial [Candidatus Latescibacterota bacterium]